MADEIMGRVSVGSKMDQIYIPKNRVGLASGSLVVVKAIEGIEESKENFVRKSPFLYGFNSEEKEKRKIEPIKLEIIKRIFSIIEKNINPKSLENIVVTGSFVERGFNFNDIDVLIIAEEKIKKDYIENIKDKIAEEIGIKAHLIFLSSKELLLGLASDPLYENMLSKFVSLNRIVFNYKRKINYQLLDLHLLKSKIIMDNFEVLNGAQKYYFAKNMIAILLFLEKKRINKENIDKKIKNELRISSDNIKQNIIEDKSFLKNFKRSYEKTFHLIMKGIKNDSK
jgi:2C-methyl-D-erythritol 2,4-cyclodiphosphate synthase